MARGFDGNEDRTDAPGPAIRTDQWRDELEGDRVGEENFETEIEVGDVRENGIRLVSGNTLQRL